MSVPETLTCTDDAIRLADALLDPDDLVAWIDRRTRACRRLRELFGDDMLVTADPVVMEVTAGARSDADRRITHRVLHQQGRVVVESRDFDEAAPSTASARSRVDAAFARRLPRRCGRRPRRRRRAPQRPRLRRDRPQRPTGHRPLTFP